MIEYIQLAWRNLWRNKKRTMITIASVFFAVFLALLMRSMQFGTYEQMEYDAIKNSTGYIQIHKKGYWDDKTINNTFENSKELDEKVKNIPNVTSLTPRLESFALASSGIMTKGVAIIGTDPSTEDMMTGLKKRVVKGNYFTADSNEVLVVTNLAKYLKLGVGDTMVLLSQGYHGITAAGNFKIVGIIKFPAENMNNEIVYMKLPDAQYFYAAPERLTSLSVMIDDPSDLQQTTDAIQTSIGEVYEVMSWKKMLAALVQSIQSDNVSGIFMLGILYIVVAFGIFGTMLMMTMERKREFAVMVAVGMQRSKLCYIMLMETIYIAIIGVLVGIAASLPIIWYYNINPIKLTGAAAQSMIDFNAQPIIPFALDINIFITQGIVVLSLTLISIIYPLYYISRFNILKAFLRR